MTDASPPWVRLPHAYPFRLLDRTLMLEPGRWAVAIKNLTRDDPLVDADGVLLPVLLAEVMAQAAGLAVVESPGHAASGMLVHIDRFRCRPPVRAGDQLLVTVRVLRRFGANVKVRAAVTVAGRRRAACELVLHVPVEAPE
jgi:3-hydroxyacyl-[acyl-carrier-protein] dehydratase